MHHKINIGVIQVGKKKKAFTIRYIPCDEAEGKLNEIVKDLIKEKINSALSQYDSIEYNDIEKSISHYIIGVCSYEKQNSNLCSGIDYKRISKG